MAQKKHSLCQANVSKATNLVLPRPPLPRNQSMLRSRFRDKQIKFPTTKIEKFYGLVLKGFYNDNHVWSTSVEEGNIDMVSIHSVSYSQKSTYTYYSTTIYGHFCRKKVIVSDSQSNVYLQKYLYVQ